MEMFDFSLLRGAAVQIIRNGQAVGSGWIAPSQEYGTYYCLTARHCVKDSDFELFLESENGQKEQLPYTKVIFEKDDGPDAAILCISYPVERYPKCLFIGKSTSEHEDAELIGYPKIREGNCLCCRVAVNNAHSQGSHIISVNIKDASVGSADLLDQIKGISGGGCIVMDSSSEYKLIAIETGFVDSYEGCSELSCLDLSVFDHLLLSNQLPLLTKPRYRYASQSWGQGRNVLHKQMEYREHERWVDTSVSRDVIQCIREYFHDQKKPDRPKLLCGFSGTGKTRTVLQACTEGAELSNAVFFETFEDFKQAFASGLRQYSAATPDEPIYLIVDDIRLEDWQELSRQIQPFANIRALAITEIGEEQKRRRDLPLLWLPPCGEEDSVRVIRNTHPALNEENARAIYRLSRNDLRFALLIAYMFENAPEFLRWEDGFASDSNSSQKIVGRIMSQFKSASAEKAVKIFSLFVDFGYTATSTNEIEFLSRYFQISSAVLKRTMRDCLDHHLGINKGTSFELSPRAFALLLFAEHHIDLIQDADMPQFMDGIPTDLMRKKFLQRAHECGDVVWKEVKGALAPWFQNKYGNACWTVSPGILGGTTAHLTLGNGRIFSPAEVEDYVEFIPEDGLPWMLHMVNVASDQTLDQFLGYESGRREFVWTCEHLSCFQEHFDICEHILFRLALHETEGAISNNSRGIWSELFGLMLSSVETPFPKRFQKLILRMQSYQDGWSDEPFRMALGCALSWSGTRMLPPKLIGGRLTPESWSETNVNTMQDLLDLHIWMLSELGKTSPTLPAPMRQLVFDCLKSHMREYTGGWISACASGIRMLYCQILEQYGADEISRTEIVIEINEVIRLQTLMKKNNDEESGYEERCAFLEQWKQRLATNAFIPRLKVLLASHVTVEREKFQDEALLLAEELLALHDAPEVLEDAISSCNVESYAFYFFADIVGKQDTNEILTPAACGMFSAGMNQFPDGYFHGVYSRTGEAPRPLLCLLEEAVSQNSHSVLRMSILYDCSISGLDRIFGLIQQGVTDNSILGMADSPWVEFLSQQQVMSLLAVLTEGQANEGAYYFFRVGGAWAKHLKETEFFAFLLECASKISVQARQQYSYEFVKLMEEMPPQFLRDCLLLIIQSIDYSRVHTLYSEHVDYLQKHARGPYAREVAFAVCDCIYEYSRQAIFRNPLAVLVRLLCAKDVLDWISVDEKKRVNVISYHLPSPSTSSVFVPDITEKVLGRYYNDDVFQQFWTGIHAFRSYSLDEVSKESQKTFKVLDQYAQYPLEAIRLWADYEKKEINNILTEKQEMDSEYSRYD